MSYLFVSPLISPYLVKHIEFKGCQTNLIYHKAILVLIDRQYHQKYDLLGQLFEVN